MESHGATIREEIIDALGDVAGAFEPGELAYLALTSKPELHVRDRLAWQLTRRGYRVAREWRRVDLAVMDEDGPAALVELKCTYTGDVSWGGGLWSSAGGRAALAAEYQASTYFEGLIRKDAHKAMALAGSGEAFVLVVVTHVEDPVPRELDAIVKYRAQLAKVADQQKAEHRIIGYLERLAPAAKVRLGDGSAFDLRCSVDVWLCGPLLPAESGEPV